MSPNRDILLDSHLLFVMKTAQYGNSRNSHNLCLKWTNLWRHELTWYKIGWDKYSSNSIASDLFFLHFMALKGLSCLSWYCNWVSLKMSFSSRCRDCLSRSASFYWEVSKSEIVIHVSDQIITRTDTRPGPLTGDNTRHRLTGPQNIDKRSKSWEKFIKNFQNLKKEKKLSNTFQGA